MGGFGSRCTRGERAILILFVAMAPAISQAELYRFENGAYLGSASLMPDWAEMLQRQQAEQDAFQVCLDDVQLCDKRYLGVRHVLLKARDLDPDKQIRLVNRYVNKRRYRRDRTASLDTLLSERPQKYRSRWSTPGEFLKRGGDCEDFVTTKYFLLRELGFSSQQLRVVVTWDRQASGYHAILAVARDRGDVWLLESDNSIRRRRHHDYRFIYALNEDSVWDHENPAPGQSKVPASGTAPAALRTSTEVTAPTEATL